MRRNWVLNPISLTRNFWRFARSYFFIVPAYILSFKVPGDKAFFILFSCIFESKRHGSCDAAQCANAIAVLWRSKLPLRSMQP